MDHTALLGRLYGQIEKRLAFLEVGFRIPFRSLFCDPGQKINRDKVMHVQAGKAVLREDRMQTWADPLAILDHMHQFGNSRLRKMSHFGKTSVRLSSAMSEEHANIWGAAMELLQRLIVHFVQP